MRRPTGYRLVWHDEFDRAGPPDAERWTFDPWRNAPWNRVASYDTDAAAGNVGVANGLLTLEVRRDGDAAAARPGWRGQGFTSAALTTRGKAAWTYGYFEVRARLPCARGLHPGLWLLPAARGARWPNDGEIDIAEQIGAEPHTVHAGLHMRAAEPIATRSIPDLCGTFHRFQLHWSHDEIRIGADGRAYMRYVRPTRASHTDWPFDRPFFLIVNAEVGGAWGADRGIDRKAFPARLALDYVRIFQR